MGKKLAALFLLPLILAFHTAASLAFLAGTRAVERTVCRVFEQIFNGTLILEHATFDIFSGLRFENISITPHGEMLPVFTARSIVLDCEGSDLLRGEFQPRAVTVVRPVITLNQTKTGAFTFENLIKKEEFGTMVQQKVLPREKRVSTLIITDGLVRLRGDGPLPETVGGLLAPGRQADLRIPVFHWVDAGGPSLRWAFGGILHHEALGDIQSEGLVDDQGLNRFFLRFVGLDLKGEQFLSCVSEAFQRGIERSGYEGEATARFTAERDEEGRVRWHVAFNGFDLLLDRDFPVALRGVKGRLNIEKNVLQSVDTTASACGGIVQFDGTLDLVNDLTCDFTLHGKGIRFSSDLERALDRVRAGRDYRAFAPIGKLDFTYKGRFSRLQPRVRGELVIMPRGSSASYEGYSDPATGWKDTFPYRLHDLRGAIKIKPGLVEIQALEGFTISRTGNGVLEELASRGRVMIDGEVGTKSPNRYTKLRIVGTDVLLDDRLKDALREKDPGTAGYLDALNAEGLMDLDVLIDHQWGGAKKPRIQALLKDVRICYETFPYPIEQASGLVLVENHRITLDRLKGYPADSAFEEGTGPIDPIKDTSSTTDRSGGIFMNGIIEEERLNNVVIQGFQQPVTPRLKEILRGILGESYGFLCDLEYEGTMDITLTLDGMIARPGLILDLDLHLDRVTGGKSPVLIEDVRGRIRIDLQKRTLEARDLAYTASGGRMILREFNLYEEEGLVSLEMKGEGRHLNLACDLTELWGSRVQEDWNLVGCSGELDLNQFDFKAKISDDGRIERLESVLDMRLNGASLAYPVKITDTFGHLVLTVVKDPDKGDNVVVKGRSEDLSFELSERLFTSVETKFLMDGDALVFSRFKGNFYGGRVSGTGENPLYLNLSPPYAFEWRLWADDADLKYIFSRKDYAFRNVSGMLTGNISLKGELNFLHRTLAEGDVYVEKGSLFELPLFGDLSRLMGNIFSTEPPTFEGGETAFKFKEGTFELSDIELKSSIMKLNGQGIVSVDGVDLNFIPSTTIVPTIPIIGTIVNLIKEGLFRFRIHGPYSDLSVSYEPIVNRLFTEDRVKDEPRYMGRIDYVFTERF